MRTRQEGCSYWRLWLPHKDMPEVTFLNDVPEKWDCDILIFHKGWINLESIHDAKRQGIKVVVDFDDWIEVDPDHFLFKEYNKNTELFKEYLNDSI